MKIRLVDRVTKETLLESDEKISVGIFVGKDERLAVTATGECVITYLRDPVRGRADIEAIRSGYGLQNRMEI